MLTYEYNTITVSIFSFVGTRQDNIVTRFITEICFFYHISIRLNDLCDCHIITCVFITVIDYV